MNQDVFELGYNQLLDGAIQITDYSDTKIEGTISSDENCVLYTSIPYDEGWKVYVDGERVETFEIGSCQLGLMLKPGNHTIKFIYMPKGFILGTSITIIAVICVGAFYICNYTVKKKRKLKHKETLIS